MHNHTLVLGAPIRRTESWRVYRIRTANSVYELEVQADGGPRRLTVLTKLGPGGEALQAFEDSQPRVAERCLYDVSPLDWVGQSLAVGTACTSPIQSVEFLTEASARKLRAPRDAAFVSGNAPALTPPPGERQAPSSRQAAEPVPDWSPFPLGCVEMAEAAASLFGAVCHRRDLPVALARAPKLARRYRLALAQCGVLLETLTQRQGGAE